MNKRHIPGFFDALARTPSFVFLCSMFLCGAAAGGLTGLHAAELVRPAALWLSGVAAARGFVLALSLAVAVAQGEGAAVLAAEALPAVISVSALLAACTLVWECTQNAAPWAKSRAPFALCVASAALSALLRVFFAILLAG